MMSRTSRGARSKASTARGIPALAVAAGAGGGRGLGGGRLVGGQAHLDGDPLVGDERGQLLDVAPTVLDPRALDLGLVEEPGPVTDAVGVEVADRLEDRLRPVVLAGVNRLPKEGLVRDLAGPPVWSRRGALFLPREVDADDEVVHERKRTRLKSSHG